VNNTQFKFFNSTTSVEKETKKKINKSLDNKPLVDKKLVVRSLILDQMNSLGSWMLSLSMVNNKQIGKAKIK